MARRNVLAELRPWKCPVCNYQRPTARRLARHIAMKWDDAHVGWRLERNILPATIETVGEVNKMIPKILPYLKPNQ